MKEKIFQALKTEYAHLGLGDEILMQQANMIEGMGVATDDNLAAIVAAQKDYLSGLQKINDRRVSDALAKAQQKAADDLKAKLDAAKKANDDALAKAIADLEAKFGKQPEPQPKPEPKKEGETEAEKALREMIEKSQKEHAAQVESMKTQMEEMMKSLKTQASSLAAFQKENEAMKAAKAEADRKAFIETTAQELGIPAWRIKEGFAINASDDNDTIKTYLTSVATNIKTAGIQPDGGKILDLGVAKPTDAELDSLIKLH